MRRRFGADFASDDGVYLMQAPLYYRLAICVAYPLYRLYLKNKQAKLPHYEREMNERFGQAYLPISHDKPVIWCHAVSLGELNTAYPLLKLVLDKGYHLWITSTTQTGFGRAELLFKEYLGVSVQHSFVPVDDVASVGRFLAHVRPVLAVFVETELWANTLSLLNLQNIPSVMVNARLTQKSFARYQKFASLSQSMMANLSLIIAQDENSHQHFIELGAGIDKVVKSHSLKWSAQISTPNPSTQTPTKNRPIWIMASTHAGEEALALSTHRALLGDFSDLLLILVPRHPERFDEVAGLCEGFVCHRRSLGQTVADDTQVYLADSMGELMMWYEWCDVAVVGGSFVDRGGHNPIEPASLGKPIIMGQYTKNCTELVQDLAQAGALIQTDDEGLYQTLRHWLVNLDLADKSGQNAKTLVLARSNAHQRQWSFIEQMLEENR